MTQYCQCATDPTIVTIVGLPSIISDIHTLSSDTCFGQFGQIIYINIDLPSNCINIEYSTTTAAYNAITWSNWMHSNNGWSHLQNKNNIIKQSEDNQTQQLQNEYSILLNKFEEMKDIQILCEKREKQFQSKIKEFINTENELTEQCYATQILNDQLRLELVRMTNRMEQMKQNVSQTMREKDEQIIQLEETKNESEETCYSTIVLNDNLLLQINRMKINFNETFQKKDYEINTLNQELDKLEETKKELDETCYSTIVLNDNLLLQINRIKTDFDGTIQKKDNEINKLKQRLKKLDKKYINIFKQLVNRITEIENINVTIENEKRLRLSARKHQTKNTQFEYESLKFELDEKYNDLCKLNDYIIELEEYLGLQLNDESYCQSWDVFEVYRWIITIKNKRFNKYKKDLIIGLRKYMIYGIKMGWLKDFDLVNMGIHSPTDRACLLAEINLMKQKCRNFDTTCGQTEGY